jgi:hypothetical protein
MAHRQGGHKTKGLVFPSNWTGKWVYRAIINTPKWQINSVLNSYKYNEWISFESTYLNGLRLPERTSPEENYIRSVLVGIKVSQASKDYNSTLNKVPLDEKVQLLKDELAVPIVGDMIRNITQFAMPVPTAQPMPSMVNVEFPETEVKEKGTFKEIPVQVLE